MECRVAHTIYVPLEIWTYMLVNLLLNYSQAKINYFFTNILQYFAYFLY